MTGHQQLLLEFKLRVIQVSKVPSMEIGMTSIVRLAAEVAAVAMLLLATPAEAQERRLAVAVGINAYRANSGLPKLQHAATDAAVLSATLRDAGFRVYEMTHEAARQDGQETMAPQLDYIRDQIRGILETPNLGDNDAVMITLHGHGVQFDFFDEKGNKTPRFYFCPADATVDGIKTANDITDRHNLLPLEELYADLANCTAATKLLVVDACRNDPNQPGVFPEALASSTLPKLPPPTGGTAAFFSCKANQRAVEDTTLRNGVFTHFLVKGLQGEADLPTAGKPADGVITFAELSAYAHRVHISKPFYMGIHEVTRGQFATFVIDTGYQTNAETDGKGGYGFDAAGNGSQKPEYTWKTNGMSETDSHPVVNVSWNDSVEFIQWLSDKEGKQYRLPTEAEWEYSCRAGSETHFSSGDSLASLKDFGNMLDTSYRGKYTTDTDQGFPFDDGFVYTSPVGRFKPNEFGLYDMHGNIWEWCQDGYDSGVYGRRSGLTENPVVLSRSSRVNRGGCRNDAAGLCRSAYRSKNDPSDRYYVLGFRVALNLSEE